MVKDGTRVHETIADVMEEYNDLLAEEDSSSFVEPDCGRKRISYSEVRSSPNGTVMGLPVVAEIPETSSGLLAHFPNGETREPTKEELVEMGRAIAERIFGNRNVQAEPVARPDAPPSPKISGNHCRLCKSFAGNDPRGALWSDDGLCLTYNHVQMPVKPEHYCNRFVFDEALRDAEPR